MESLHILKVLSNGWVVPYPEEVIYKDTLLLKDYRLNGFPCDAGATDMDYDAYLEWLQDYLMRCKIDLTSEQCKIYNYIITDKYFGCGFLGGEAGFYEASFGLHPAEYNFPENFEETFDINHLTGVVHDDPYKEFLTYCEEDSDGIRPTRLEFVLREYGRLLLMQSEAIQFQQYWPGFVKLEPLPWIAGTSEENLEPADSAWRVYLSLILKRIQTKDGRIKELNRFFNAYGDAIHK